MQSQIVSDDRCCCFCWQSSVETQKAFGFLHLAVRAAPWHADISCGPRTAPCPCQRAVTISALLCPLDHLNDMQT